MSRKLSVDVWSDIACPWCHIGKRRLETALEGFPHAGEVEMAKKYGTSVLWAEARIQRVDDTAAAEGLRFDSRNKRPGNTFNAHELPPEPFSLGKDDAVSCSVSDADAKGCA